MFIAELSFFVIALHLSETKRPVLSNWAWKILLIPYGVRHITSSRPKDVEDALTVPFLPDTSSMDIRSMEKPSTQPSDELISEDGNRNSSFTAKAPPIQHLCSTFAKFLLLCLATWGLIAALYLLFHGPLHQSNSLHNSYRHSPNTSCYCGTSTHEALTKYSCLYDSAALAWLPPHCRDDPLLHTFETSGPNPDGSWPYFRDKNATVPLSLHEVAALADVPNATFYLTHGWHVMHCVYYWEKLFRLEGRRREGGEVDAVVERRYGDVGHIRHCGELLRLRTPLERVDTIAGVRLDSDLLE
ncbi:MAG: hypothetical protein Q9227_005149 [Pyrenula ochraceoflavens]